MANEVTVTADINGTLVSWTNGYFSSPDRKLLNQVKKVAKLGDARFDPQRSEALTDEVLDEQVPAIALSRYGEEVYPGSDSVLAAAAAMKSVYPGRTIFPAYASVAMDDYFDDARTVEEDESYVLLNSPSERSEDSEEEPLEGVEKISLEEPTEG